MPFEQHVRPFETPNISPPRRSPTSAGASPGPIQVLISGQPAVGAQIAVSVSHALLPGGNVTVTYTFVGGDNLQNGAIGIVNAVNGNSSLLAIGVQAAGVSGQPFQFTITQPATLKPQAVITASSTGTVILSLSNGSVQLRIAKDNRIKTVGGSHNGSEGKYNHKYPREISFKVGPILDLPTLPPITFP